MTLKLSSFSNIEKSILDLLNDKGIEIHTQSSSEVAIYCPFHRNENSPALYINTKTGLWQCFNPSCGKKGNFRQLYYHITGKEFGREWILDPVNLQRELDNAVKMDLYEDELTLDSVSLDYSLDSDKSLLETLINRGYSYEALIDFEIGYSRVKDRIVIPVRDHSYKLVGLIGRAVHEWQDPRYLYNKGFKRADVLFNIQTAKMYDSVIICEGSLDAIKISQSGFKNVVATLGAKVSPNQIKIIKRFFDKIIIFSDADEAGEAMKSAILAECCGKEIFVASVPDGLKDPGDMTDKQIKQAIEQSKIYIGDY